MKATRRNAVIIDQDGREVRPDTLRGWNPAREGVFGHIPPFSVGSAGDPLDGTVHLLGLGGEPLTREQRIQRLDALARLLDVAFVMPGTNIRYGIDGLIGLIPVVGDLITTAISLWIVREARAIGAPWHVTARMLGNVALDGVVGLVPLAGDAFDVMFRANMRNMRLLRRWLDRQR